MTNLFYAVDYVQFKMLHRILFKFWTVHKTTKNVQSDFALFN